MRRVKPLRAATDSLREAAAAVAIRTALLLSALAIGATDEEIIGEEEGWGLEVFSLSFTYLDQDGRGYQSKAGAIDGGLGSEDITVVAPTLYAKIRQSDSVRHHVYLPVDLVTSASANALDAISSASAVTEAADLDITTEVDVSENVGVAVKYGIHWEEPMTSLFLGGGTELRMAEDNSILRLDILGIVDMFDTLLPTGADVGLGVKVTGSANVSFSQVLSPTTIAWLGYGLTFQKGTLETTYNSVPIEGGGRMAEMFPEMRLRHAWTARVAQHIPYMRATVRAGYRFYIDDIGIQAHTVDGRIYQYLGPYLLAEASYRFHTQTAAEFFRTSVPTDYDLDLPRTADSDLAAFDAHEIGARVMFLFNPKGSAIVSNEYFSLGYTRYWRPNLKIDGFSLSYAGQF
jgi:hypothetical protein